MRRKISRKQLEKLRAEGLDLVQQLGEVYREGFHDMAGHLLRAVSRCRAIEERHTLSELDGGVVLQCECQPCREARRALALHLKSAAVAKQAYENFLQMTADRLGAAG